MFTERHVRLGSPREFQAQTARLQCRERAQTWKVSPQKPSLRCSPPLPLPDVASRHRLCPGRNSAPGSGGCVRGRAAHARQRRAQLCGRLRAAAGGGGPWPPLRPPEPAEPALRRGHELVQRLAVVQLRQAGPVSGPEVHRQGPRHPGGGAERLGRAHPIRRAG